MHKIKNFIENFISWIPFIGKWRDVFLKHSVPGNWASPIPDWDSMKKKHEKLFNDDKALYGLNLNEERQKEICRDCKSYVKDFYETYRNGLSSHNLYRLKGNIYYQYYDGINLFCFIRLYKPKRIIEIGSGYSSCLMMDVNRQYFNNKIDLTFIDPNTQRLLSLIQSSSQVQLIKNNIQDIDITLFDTLRENDFLFIDSSHISKMDSDLNYILFKILPKLNKGVLIHFHDIVFPFEYPQKIIDQKYAWNETYFLRAFLMYNHSFSIEFMNSFLARTEEKLFNDTFKVFPDFSDFDSNFEGSVWIRKNLA